MKLPAKFKLNTEDFKIYYDDKKKTHVAENIETGEKTNIGVFGLFMQMGIIEQVEKEEKISGFTELNKKIESLETKILDLQKSIDNISSKSVVKKEVKKTPEEKPTEIKEHVMEKAIEEVKEEEKESEKSPPNVKVDSEEEIDNWMDI